MALYSDCCWSVDCTPSCRWHNWLISGGTSSLSIPSSRLKSVRSWKEQLKTLARDDSGSSESGMVEESEGERGATVFAALRSNIRKASAVIWRKGWHSSSCRSQKATKRCQLKIARCTPRYTLRARFSMQRSRRMISW